MNYMERELLYEKEREIACALEPHAIENKVIEQLAEIALSAYQKGFNAGVRATEEPQVKW